MEMQGALKGYLESGEYRVGDYRLICDIQDNKVIIYVLTVGHRKEVYKVKTK